MQSRGRTQRDRDANGGALLLLAAARGSGGHPSPPPAEWSSEREEISRAKREPAAFAPLYERYVDAVYTYCLRRIGNPDIAADMTAGVFTRALAALPRFREDGGSFRSWLFSIAHNTVIDGYRRHRDHASLETDDVGRTLAHQGDGPERIAIQRDLRDAFQEAMGHLTNAQREVVAMRLAGLTGPEIAQAMGMTIPGMKSTQYRAYARLRELLRPYADDFPAGKDNNDE
jgi:RNA polymerase sigma factor (sigma-70 family)